MKRATCQILDYCVFKSISIHALVKRATAVEGYVFSSDSISIHALVKRATFCQNMAIQHAIDFNPRPREEGDIRCAAL